MEIKLLKKEKDELEIEIIGETATLLHPLRERLLEDDAVETAFYTLPNLEGETSKLKVKVKTGKPQSALKKAAKQLAKECKECYAAFEEGLKAWEQPHAKDEQEGGGGRA